MSSSQKGSITVEAALVLPIFLCAVISIAFLIKAVFVHEVIQHAISETANELSTYSYLLSASGMNEADKLITEGMHAKNKKLNDHMASYIEGYNALSDLPDSLKDKQGSSSSDLNEEVQSMLFSMGEISYSRAKAVLLGEVTRLFMKKHLKTEKLPDADKRLKALNVEEGFEGLDFSRSQLYSDGKNIEIVVQYKLNLALPYNVLPDLFICQRAYSRAWLEGDSFPASGNNGNEGDEKEEDRSVWDLPPMERGREIQTKYYHKNTPKYFKVLTRFDNGTATRVSSIDTRSLTYKKASNLKSAVKSDIKKLAQFEGDSRNGMEVRSGEIKRRKLIIVVPEGEVSKEQKQVLEQCLREAENAGIEMTIDEL